MDFNLSINEKAKLRYHGSRRFGKKIKKDIQSFYHLLSSHYKYVSEKDEVVVYLNLKDEFVFWLNLREIDVINPKIKGNTKRKNKNKSCNSAAHGLKPTLQCYNSIFANCK